MLNVDFLLGFVQTENSVRCSEIGLIDLETKKECRRAVGILLPDVYWGGSGRWRREPKGCYVSKWDNEFYWNKLGDTKKYWAQSICKSGKYSKRI